MPDGQWSGTTNQGKSITLTVKNQSITELVVAYQIDRPGCAFDGSDSTQPGVALNPSSIFAGDFSYQYKSAASAAQGTISGLFQHGSPWSATGSMSLTTPACAGETRILWNATKQ